jgi:hypothetical protein
MLRRDTVVHIRFHSIGFLLYCFVLRYSNICARDVTIL